MGDGDDALRRSELSRKAEADPATGQTVTPGRHSAEHLSHDERGRHYDAEGITVFFNARKCVHSGVCLRGLPLVFDTSRRPWIRADLDSPENIAERIDLCPSGALSYLLKPT